MNGPFMNAETEEAMVNVRYRIHASRMPLAGLTVGEARGHLTELLRIGPDTLSVVDGEEVDDAMLLAAGQTLCFIDRVGRKC